ncbi:hypothetical protein EIN_059430 [Entamoeba invadens IP1]|uniref:hypothetical protein n=1 Tax=Entamoeba invadens IP1 TaxID=370355 RepID=UPI0002C3D62D|nr:hypothetical protein EIN_059430 [Entamoeba invadens IP1]ELP93458.1 hypothetical protein EIN_059430 [Entamoeba invadens IP1]|eukprot:XP_004260229.1 hypothetical protein EIN_059430 [Entamoeba invadens IP1]
MEQEKITSDLLETLQGWCGFKKFNIIYDTDIDPINLSLIGNLVLHRSHIYYVIIDKAGNVFGCYNKGSVRELCLSVDDPSHFVFSLKNTMSPLTKPKQFFTIKNNHRCFYMPNSDEEYSLFRIGFKGGIRIGKPNTFNSYCYNIQNTYPELKDSTLLGLSGQQFSVERILLIQISE